MNKHLPAWPILFAWALLLGAAAHADEPDWQPAPPQTVEQISQSLQTLRDALKAGDYRAATNAIDQTELARRIVSYDLMRPLNKGERNQFTYGLRQGLLKPDATVWTLLNPEHFQIRSVWIDPVSGLARVYTRIHTQPDGPINQAWLMKRADERWRICDLEHPDIRLSWSASAAILMADDAALMQPGTEPRVKALVALSRCGDLLEAGEIDEAEQLLSTLPEDLPRYFAAFRAVYFALVYSHRDYSQVPAALEEAERLGMPLIGTAYLWANVGIDQDDYETTLSQGQRYFDRVGTDTAMADVWATALYHLNRDAEAVKVLEPALQDEPADIDALRTFAVVLPDDQAPRIAPILAKLEPLHDYYEELADELVDADCYAALAELNTLYRERHPDQPFVAYYEALVAHYRDEQTPQAIERLEAAVDQIKDPDHRYWAGRLLVDLYVEVGRTLDAYRNALDPADAFLQIADDLDTTEQADLLHQLVTLRTTDNPNDLWIHYYRGTAYYLQQRDAEAVSSYFMGMAMAQSEEDREFFRFGAVRSQYFLGKGLDAYRDIPPAEATFVQLAELYGDNGDGTGLRKLLERHRAKHNDDAATYLFTAMADYIDEQWQAVVDNLSDHREVILADEDNLNRYESWLINALLYLDRVDDAHTLALESTERDGDPYFLVLTNAKAGRTNEAMSAIEVCLNEFGYTAAGFYDHPQLSPLLRESQAWASFRQQHPEPIED